MDFLNILLFCLISIIIGAVLMLLIQYYAFVKYFDPEDGGSGGGGCNSTDNKNSIGEKFVLPDDVLSSINSSDPDNKNSIIAVNLVLQFLFHELRHSNKVRKWFHRKLSLELDELISKTTTGKLFDKLTIRDLDLGNQFPEIKNVKVHHVDLHDIEGHIENLDLLLNLHYQGNFKLSIDADMVLGKKGFLSVKVKHISGLARLQFTRKPYTHWSLTFVGDPQVDLGVESQFQGRQMQSNVTSLISNQIRKAVRRKHTLPNYKLRYKPFFHHSTDDMDTDLGDQVPNGTLDVTISELSRLSVPTHLTHVYCVLTLASMPWVLARQHDDRNLIVSLDLEIHKAKNQQIGIVFKQTEQMVVVEAVIQNTPAAKAKLQKGDVLVSIEGKRVSHINHVAKIIKSLNRPMFMLRIERIIGGIIKNDAILEDYELGEDFNDLNISFSKHTESVQIYTGSSRMNRSDSSDSSHSNTPSNSPRKSSEIYHGKIKSGKNLSRNNSENLQTPSTDECKLTKNSDLFENNFNQFQQHSTIDCEMNTFIRMDDLASFKLNEQHSYLNLNVFGRFHEEIILLGYLCIPVSSILAECGDSNSYLKQFPLTPPDTPNLSNHPLSTQSGFDPDLCFGDVLLSFMWNGVTQTTVDSGTKKLKSSMSGSTDKLEDDRQESPPRQHDFIRTHFHRATQCDFCGKKIWLKDAVQCRECTFKVHKKCVLKCQNSTICGPTDTVGSSMHQVEFKLTEPTADDEFEEIEDISNHKIDGHHRQSFSDLLVQGLKRVNSANNLAIPGIVNSLSQGSRSLPPSPQHTPRKQSLSQSTNPFVILTQRLEQIPDGIVTMTREQISELTDLIIGWGEPDEVMGLAKTSSRNLYADLEPKERVDKINCLLTKLRIALDSETSEHQSLESSRSNLDKTGSNVSLQQFSDTTLLLQTKKASTTSTTTTTTSPTTTTQSTIESAQRKFNQEHEMARKAFLIGQSEERVQALSVIMLFLCSGLQYAQGCIN